jgi:hypothetical protein
MRAIACMSCGTPIPEPRSSSQRYCDICGKDRAEEMRRRREAHRSPYRMSQDRARALRAELRREIRAFAIEVDRTS